MYFAPLEIAYGEPYCSVEGGRLVAVRFPISESNFSSATRSSLAAAARRPAEFLEPEVGPGVICMALCSVKRNASSFQAPWYSS